MLVPSAILLKLRPPILPELMRLVDAQQHQNVVKCIQAENSPTLFWLTDPLHVEEEEYLEVMMLGR